MPVEKVCTMHNHQKLRLSCLSSKADTVNNLEAAIDQQRELKVVRGVSIISSGMLNGVSSINVIAADNPVNTGSVV